jgi:NADPH:quinone reductase-like Zn-dependent oxidoreductase
MPPPWLLGNGAGGGVGGFTLQLAKEAGAIVIATASPRSTDTVRAFGADHIVDYTATTIAEAVKDPVDVVVNLVAGSREDTEALLDVTKPGGVPGTQRRRTTARPDATPRRGGRRRHGSRRRTTQGHARQYRRWIRSLGAPNTSGPYPSRTAVPSGTLRTCQRFPRCAHCELRQPPVGHLQMHHIPLSIRPR